MKVLNLYAGIGGNRKLWENVDVTAVEWDSDIAKVYSDYFPNDKIIIGDAHEYLKKNYEKFDFIWASPPCQTHSKMNRVIVNRKQRRALYPDMKLWQEIIFLKNWCESKWVVENVIPMYEPLIAPNKKIERHYFWCNFRMSNFNLDEKSPLIGSSKERRKIEVFEKAFGFNLDGYTFKKARKDQVLNNCVHPKTGLHILNAARGIITKSKTKQFEIEL